MAGKPKKQDPVDSQELAAELGISTGRINSLYAKRAENEFPAHVDQRGRARLWDLDEVRKWHEGRQPSRLEELSLVGDPDELLNASQVAKVLDYKNKSQITTYLKEHPGYFPSPTRLSISGPTRGSGGAARPSPTGVPAGPARASGPEQRVRRLRCPTCRPTEIRTSCCQGPRPRHCSVSRASIPSAVRGPRATCRCWRRPTGSHPWAEALGHAGASSSRRHSAADEAGRYTASHNRGFRVLGIVVPRLGPETARWPVWRGSPPRPVPGFDPARAGHRSWSPARSGGTPPIAQAGDNAGIHAWLVARRRRRCSCFNACCTAA